MIELNFAHLCDYASLSEGGKVNILGIFSNINVSNFPYKHSQMYIVVNIFVGKSGKYRQTVKLIKKDAPEQIKEVSELNIEAKNMGNVGFINKLDNIVFEKPGEYEFQIYINDSIKSIKTIPLSLILK